MDIVPSSEARILFGQMVARSNPNLVLTLACTLKLAADRKQAGHLRDGGEVDELVSEGWIGAHPNGGWMLFEEVMSIEA